tara:strand:- start:181 stop:447 length:267 start_codon:yes stop_codon:yes gene_type:complete
MADTVAEIAAMSLLRPVIVWDEAGETDHVDLEPPFAGTYIFGKTHVNGFFRDIIHDDTVRIVTPRGGPCLFGVPAAAIALEMRARKWP